MPELLPKEHLPQKHPFWPSKPKMAETEFDDWYGHPCNPAMNIKKRGQRCFQIQYENRQEHQRLH